MRVLAIDSSGLTATVAIVEDDTTIAEFTINYKKTHSQTLLPMIDEMVKMVEADLNTIDAIAVAGGPGSFTGLRIGSATAKGLGLALGKPLIHIPTDAPKIIIANLSIVAFLFLLIKQSCYLKIPIYYTLYVPDFVSPPCPVQFSWKNCPRNSSFRSNVCAPK